MQPFHNCFQLTYLFSTNLCNYPHKGLKSPARFMICFIFTWMGTVLSLLPAAHVYNVCSLTFDLNHAMLKYYAEMWCIHVLTNTASCLYFTSLSEEGLLLKYLVTFHYKVIAHVFLAPSQLLNCMLFWLGHKLSKLPSILSLISRTIQLFEHPPF